VDNPDQAPTDTLRKAGIQDTYAHPRVNILGVATTLLLGFREHGLSEAQRHAELQGSAPVRYPTPPREDRPSAKYYAEVGPGVTQGILDQGDWGNGQS
jgi:hypothetical protein